MFYFLFLLIDTTVSLYGQALTVIGFFGQLRAELERAGTPCGLMDMQIGAHARSEGLTIVTNNRREFDRMPGLRVENWVSA